MKDHPTQGSREGVEGIFLPSLTPMVPEANNKRPVDAMPPCNINQIVSLKEVAPKEALTIYLLLADYPKGWKVSRLMTYNGMGDPNDHIHAFIIGMEDMTTWKDIWCLMFCRTLTENEVGWYRTLPLGSTHTYEELERTFIIASSHRVHERNDVNDLLNICQGEKETLQEYLARFAVIAQSAEDPHDSAIIMALRNGLQPCTCA